MNTSFRIRGDESPQIGRCAGFPDYPDGSCEMYRCLIHRGPGWQLDTRNQYNSALLSVRQITLDHTHYESIEGCNAATALYGRVFKPTVHREIYAFEDLPRAMEEMHSNIQTGIPVVRIASEMPASVQSLIP